MAMKQLGLVAVLGLAAVDVAVAADFSFGRPIALLRERNTFANVAVGDANGDGRDDLAATAVLPSGVDHRLTLFLQSPNGSMGTPLHLPLKYASNSHTYPVAFVDLDGDGRQEIAAGSALDGVLVVKWDGERLSAVEHPAAHACEFLTTGEIDGDGRSDVVCHDWKETATVFHGDGNGGFRPPVPVRTPMGTYEFDWKSLRLGDVTGDGRPDLLATASNLNSFAVFPNNGLGGFSPPNVYTHPKSPARVWAAALEIVDVDGDGSLEVVTASPDNRPEAALNVYRRGTNGYLALSERIPVHDSPTALIAGDVDGDGDDEILAGHFSFNEVTVLGSGAAGLSSQASYDLPGFGSDIPVNPRQGHSNGLALGDLNNDGCMDLAGATHSGVVLLYGCRPFSKRIPISDFDGDGVSDLLWRHAEFSETVLWQSADLGAWYECLNELYPAGSCPKLLLGPSWVIQATGDFDGDGNSDVFWRDRTSGNNLVWDRAFYRRDVSAVSTQDWQVVGAGDFDGDDRSDLLWRNSRSGINAIWKSANPATPQAVATVADQRWKVAGVGDFDGDGRSDILWRHAESGANSIWRSGSVDTPRAVAAAHPQWRVAGVGDFNGDGRDDIAWRHAGSGANTIWLAGDSANALAVSSVAHPAWSVGAVADYNGDGRADLMWRNADSGANVIWRSADSRRPQEVATQVPDVELVR